MMKKILHKAVPYLLGSPLGLINTKKYVITFDKIIGSFYKHPLSTKQMKGALD